MDPKVSFIVPCYNLAHLLPDCVSSILSQTYSDFELLIMDDCSPDQTPEVARSFRDSRVRPIRNDLNLGHLQNYNKGIRMARGTYIWLISADDRLRRPYVLERFVSVIESRPDVGFIYCPIVQLQGGEEIDGRSYGGHGPEDAVIDGREFLKKLMGGNCVYAPAVMARKQCYEQAGFFPLDLPYTGDWYLWCHFSLYANVAFLAEAMVNYRLHDLNISHAYLDTTDERIPEGLTAEALKIRWRIRYLAEAEGYSEVAEFCKANIASDYAARISRKLREDWAYGITSEQFERSLLEHCQNPSEVAYIRARVYAGIGDHYYESEDIRRALQYYRRALRLDLYNLRTIAKYILLEAGKPGVRMRRGIALLRERLKR
jgi:glycosyltransferase involved in cell wall biosynthesis